MGCHLLANFHYFYESGDILITDDHTVTRGVQIMVILDTVGVYKDPWLSLWRPDHHPDTERAQKACRPVHHLDKSPLDIAKARWFIWTLSHWVNRGSDHYPDTQAGWQKCWIHIPNYIVCPKLGIPGLNSQATFCDFAPILCDETWDLEANVQEI